jgi:hypothetical protein
VARNAHRRPLGDVVGTSEVLTGHSSNPSSHGSKSLPVRKSFPCLELLEWPFVSRLCGWWGGGVE